ncbi:hypothetical protein A6P39_040200 [Streptomyces sp. FXJ1.172]|uniref:hypothetical protein n=1 Tax=Streptomyces sp. FXJ1.172 TaxID=710705 RepID=UPI0007CF7394|nr:hypothetical protein [Streptomyces sp. FXJ1.172]WEO99770.1 hypothetical protein A6P39_040200 [Streptomyces sp. FXJ1.172]
MAASDSAPGLGCSLRTDAGDLVFDPDTGDLALVEGRQALAQALTLSIETQLGSDRVNTRFGFDLLALGTYAEGLHSRKEYLKMQLVRCISSDPRVADVREIFFDDEPRFFELHPDIDPAARSRVVAAQHADRSHTAYVVVDTIAQDTLTLQVGSNLD